jgi:hypothetical protein
MRATERFRFACLPEHLYHYRQHAASSTIARKKSIEFYRDLVVAMRAERRATGSDRLSRGERVQPPDFREESGGSAYRRALAHYDHRDSHAAVRTGHWGRAWWLAARSWGRDPLKSGAIKHLVKTSVAAFVPEARRRWFPPVPAVESILVQDIERMSPVWPEWDALIASSDTPQAFFLTSGCVKPFWRWHGTSRTLAIVLVRDANGNLAGAAPFYLETTGRRLSRHQRLALLGSPESGADYLDVIARPGMRCMVLREAFACLKREGIRWERLSNCAGRLLAPVFGCAPGRPPFAPTRRSSRRGRSS